MPCSTFTFATCQSYTGIAAQHPGKAVHRFGRSRRSSSTLGKEALEPGDEAFCKSGSRTLWWQRGDRFIIRLPSPAET